MHLYGEIYWLIIIIILCIVESLTYGLVCIWFAGGAVAAMIASAVGLNVMLQYIIFVLTSAVLLISTRPLIVKFLSTKKTSTNSDRLIGRTGVVIIDIDHNSGKGQVKVDGQVWSAKSIGDVIINEGESVDIVDIEGVKLVVMKHLELGHKTVGEESAEASRDESAEAGRDESAEDGRGESTETGMEEIVEAGREFGVGTEAANNSGYSTADGIEDGSEDDTAGTETE